MFLKRYKVLTKEYMQKYKVKIDKKVPRLEKKIRRILVRKINKEVKSCIKYGRMDVFLDLSKNNALGYSLAVKADSDCYEKILLEVISECERNGIRVNKRRPRPFYEFNFHLEGVFDNDN